MLLLKPDPTFYPFAKLLRSPRLSIVDTKPNPREPPPVKIIAPEEVKTRSGYTRHHTMHCRPSGIYISALGAQNGGDQAGVRPGPL